MKIITHQTPVPVLHDVAPNSTRRRCGKCGTSVLASDGRAVWRGTVRRWFCTACQTKKP